MPTYTAPLTLAELRRHKPQIEAIVGKYGVHNIRVFGSVVRGEAKPGSDIDFLVTFTRPLGWDYVAPKLELEDYLHHPVDVVNDRCLSRHLAPYILEEAVAL